MLFHLTRRLRRTVTGLGLFGFLLACSSGQLRAQGADDVIDSAMFENPKLVMATVSKTFSPRLVPLWLHALSRSENDLKRRAAQAIGQARQRGLATELDVTIQPLLDALDDPQNDASVRLACAQALIALDASQHADRLLAHARADGLDMRDLVEPALARWKYKPAAQIWLERLNRPREAGRGWLLAITGLGMLGDTRALARLRSLALDHEADSITRLEAARVVANMQPAGLEADSASLIEHPGAQASFDELIAATLLRKQRGDRAMALLKRLATDAAPAAQVAALDALMEADSTAILPLLPRLIPSRDAAVRLRSIEAFKRNPRSADLTRIVGLLDDPHSGVRSKARSALVSAAGDPDKRKVIVENAEQLLRGDRWRSLEQSTLLMAILQDKSVAPRLVELLDFPRPEVFVAAAWALRKLAVPATLDGQVRAIDRRLSEALQPGRSRPYAMIEREIIQLCQSVGQARYVAAGPVLRKLVAPTSAIIGSEARAAAIWALGLIYEEKQPPGLIGQVVGRLTGILPGGYAEDPIVRTMCAITLGRMKAQAAEPDIRVYSHDIPSQALLPYACCWALERIKGEKMGPPGVINLPQVGWFLEPID